MKKTYKFLILFIFLTSSFLLIKPVKAEISQLTGGTLDTTYVNGGSIKQRLGSGYNQIIQGFYLFIENNNGISATPRMIFSQYDTSDYGIGTTTVMSCTGISMPNGSSDVFYFQDGFNGVSCTPASYTLLANKYYQISVRFLSSNRITTFGSDTPTTYYTAKASGCNSSYGEDCDFDYLYFKILSPDEVSSQSNRVFRLTPDFEERFELNNVYFTGTYSTNASYDQIIIQINQLLTATSSQLYTNLYYYTTASTTIQNYSQSVYLPDGNYNYIAFLNNSTSNINNIDYYQYSWPFVVGSSTERISQFLPPFQPNMPNDLTETTICKNIDTTTIMGSIECAFRKLIYWSIIPSNDSINGLTDSYNKLKLSFPLNAFFGLTDAIKVGLATSTTLNDNLGIPFIKDTGEIYILPILSSTSLPNLIGTENTNLFRTTLGWLLWIGAGILVYLTFKKI